MSLIVCRVPTSFMIVVDASTALLDELQDSKQDLDGTDKKSSNADEVTNKVVRRRQAAIGSGRVDSGNLALDISWGPRSNHVVFCVVTGHEYG
jgi:hypothetical protein